MSYDGDVFYSIFESVHNIEKLVEGYINERI